MKPYIHAVNSVKRWGGEVADYLGIHNMMDWSKSSHPDMRHRAIFHNSLGCFVAERLFGYPYKKMEQLAEKHGWTEEEKKDIMELLDLARTDATTSIVNSDGIRVEVRDIAERHIIEDMGKIPTVSDYLNGLPMYEWLGGPRRKPKVIRMVD